MQYKSNIDEDVLVRRAQTLKRLGKTYKFLECIEDILKINPYNTDALIEIADYMGERNV